MPALTPWPHWNQLDDWTTDADGNDENAENNCGPQSVAMCLKYLTGVELPADFIKDAMYGPRYVGYTFDERLADFLQRRCEIPTRIHRGDAQTLLRPTVEASIARGLPIIVLYYWDIRKPESGHWAPVFAYDEQGCTRLNPWGGVAETWSWAKFEAWQKRGHALVLQRTRDEVLTRNLDEGSPLEPVVALLDEAIRAGYAVPAQGEE